MKEEKINNQICTDSASFLMTNAAKKVRAEASKKYRENHRERISEYNRRYRAEHKEEIAQYMKEYRRTHKESAAAAQARYWERVAENQR